MVSESAVILLWGEEVRNQEVKSKAVVNCKTF